MAGEVVFTLGEDTLIRGMQLQERRGARIGVAATILLALLMSSSILMGWHMRGLLWWVIGLVALAAYELITLARLPARLRKEIRENPAACQPVEMRWSDAGDEIYSGGSQTRRPWARIWRWREDQDVYFTYQTSQVMPKQALADAGLLNDFRTQLQSLVLRPRPPAEAALWAIGGPLSYVVPALGFGYLAIVTDWGRVQSVGQAIVVTVSLIGGPLIVASLSFRVMALLFNSAERYEKEQTFYDEFPTVAPGGMQIWLRRYIAWVMRPAGYDSRNRAGARRD